MTETQPRTCDTLVRGLVLTIDPDRRVLRDGYVAISDGLIVDVGEGETDWQAAQELGGPGRLVMPGLVNTHTHLVQGCIRGMAEGTRFEERLFGFYYPMTGAADEEDSYWSALPPVMDLLRSGVTTTTDDHFTQVDKDSMTGVLRALRDTGIRTRAARLMLSDPNAVPANMRESIGTGIAETERLAREFDSETMSVTASSIGITYVTSDELHTLYDWTVANNKQFDIHAPSMMDAKYLAETRGWTGGSFEWLSAEGMLGPNVIAIHAQNLRPGEARLLADAGASVSLVPDMELILGMVTFDSRQYLEAGVKMSIGLDGPVVSYGHNLWMGLRGYLMAQRIGDSARKLAGGDRGKFGDELLFGTPEDAIELGTIGGAAALGLADRIGSLETGKEADLLVIDLAGETTTAPDGALLANLVWSGGPAPESIEQVIVRGRTVAERGEPTGAGRREAIARANEVQRRLLTETGCDSFIRRGTKWNWGPGL
jgi:5-methylthioadenosine/S-adenosylhomocysteine deaminase